MRNVSGLEPIHIVMAGHSRSKNGVASLAYVRPSTSLFLLMHQDVDARDKRGHDGSWRPSPHPANLPNSFTTRS